MLQRCKPATRAKLCEYGETRIVSQAFWRPFICLNGIFDGTIDSEHNPRYLSSLYVSRDSFTNLRAFATKSYHRKSSCRQTALNLFRSEVYSVKSMTNDKNNHGRASNIGKSLYNTLKMWEHRNISP